MNEIIRIKCNGPGKHLNEVNLKELLSDDIVLREYKSNDDCFEGINIQNRYIKRCKRCVEGEIIITRDMIEKVLKKTT